MHRDQTRRWNSPSVFTLIALCFLLTFGTVTFVTGCDGGDQQFLGKTSFTGVQLVTHTVPVGTGSSDTGDQCSRSTGREPDPGSCVEIRGATAADIAFAAAIVGLVLGLLGVVGGGWCAAVGLAALLQMWISLGSLPGPGGFSPREGYLLALVLFGGAGVLHFRRWRERNPEGLQLPTGTGFRGDVAAIAIRFGAFASLLLCFAFNVLWLAPLIWALGLAVLGTAKTRRMPLEVPPD